MAFTYSEISDIIRQLQERRVFREERYEVGDIYITTLATNPAIRLGYGTWEPFGAGRVLVGLDDGGDADFDEIEETGGAKTLEIADHEPHTHETTATATISTGEVQSGTGSMVVDGISATPAESTEETPTLTHVEEGSGLAEMPIMPPYIVVAIWKRTA